MFNAFRKLFKTKEQPASDSVPALEEKEKEVEQKWNYKLQIYDTPFAGCEQRLYHGAGMSHYADALMEIAIENGNYACTKRELKEFLIINRRVYQYRFEPKTIDLVPEPDNTYDPNAVKIIINNRHVGYIRAEETDGIVELFNSEKVKRVQAVIEGGKYKILLGPADFAAEGVPITSYDLKKDEAPFSIRIYFDVVIE